MADFKKASMALLAAAAVPALAVSAVANKLPAGVVAVPMIRGVEQAAYYAEFQVGTPPQKQLLKIDTGSPRYAFLDPHNAACAKPGQPCKTYGTFDNTTSS
ncbi:hypothetical protein E4U43_006860, partial [Claviceps pusilla]